MLDQIKKQHQELKNQVKEGYLADVFIMCDLKDIETAHWQIDFFDPQTKKMISFAQGKEQTQQQEVFSETPEKVEELRLDKVKIEMREVIEEAKVEVEKRTDNVKKIIAILQNLNSIPTWNITFMTSNFYLYNRKINAETGTLIKESYESVLSFRPQ